MLFRQICDFFERINSGGDGYSVGYKIEFLFLADSNNDVKEKPIIFGKNLKFSELI